MPVRETIALSSLPSIFNLAQDDNTYNALVAKLTRIFKDADVEEFSSSFLQQLKTVLCKAGDVNTSVDRIFEFIVQFVIQIAGLDVPDNSDIPEESLNFFYSLFYFFKKYHDIPSSIVRKRICQFISKLLQRMSPEALLDIKICDMIIEMMKERIKDKVPLIRLQAILAMYRLQDKSDKNCPVTKALLEAIETDNSAEVRRLALSKISLMHRSIIEVVLDRTDDVSEKVRKETYIVLSKLHIKQFTIEQRKRLLNTGLYDNNDLVKTAVKNVLLPAWLKRLDYKFLDLLKAIDLQVSSMEVATKALMSLFSNITEDIVQETLETLMDPLHLISYENLTVESAFFWRCYVFFSSGMVSERNNYVWESTKSYDATAEALLPDLNVFCEYIKMYYALISGKCAEETPWKKMEYEFILIQLIELCKVYDYADEFGRKELKILCIELLKYVEMESIRPIMQVYFMLQTNLNEGISKITELINDLLYPNNPGNNMDTKNDNEIVSFNLTEEQENDLKFKIAKYEVTLIELKEIQEDAVKSENFEKAQELKNNISEIHDKIQQLKAELVGSSISKSNNMDCDSISEESEEEMGNPLENLQADVVQRCLFILKEMLHLSVITTLTPELRTLFQMLVSPACKSDNSLITPLATEVMGSCCLRDENLAKENFTTFFALCGNSDICVSSLKVIFDFLLLFGPSTFNIDCSNEDELNHSHQQNKSRTFHTDDSSSNESSHFIDPEPQIEEEEKEKEIENIHTNSVPEGLISGYTFISVLVDLLDDEFVEARFTVVHGLSQLMATGKLKSVKVLTRLILIWFHPASKSCVEIRDCLNFFFPFFVKKCPWSLHLFENSLIPTMNTLFNAPIHNPLSGVDQKCVLKVLCDITNPSFVQENPEVGENTHFNIAVLLCNRIMDLKDLNHKAVLLKGLDYLDLSYTDPCMLPTITYLIGKIIKKFTKKNFKKLIPEAKKLEKKFEALKASKNSSNVVNTFCLENTTEDKCEVEEMDEL